MRTHLLLLAALPIAVAVACSATHRVQSSGSLATSAGSGGQGAATATGPGGAAQSSSAGIGGQFGIGGGGGKPPTCSADLQSVVDEHGMLQPCPSDQGCAAGQCVPACAAAAASLGSIGCDFYAPDPPFYKNGQSTTYNGACYAVFVANTWSRPAQITVSRNGQSFPLSQFGRIPGGVNPNTTYDPIPATGVPPNQVAVLFLSHDPNAEHPNLNIALTCPVTPAIVSDAAIQGSGKGSAFHVVSDTPITAYDILPYGGAKTFLPSASLLFPDTAWGTNYYAVAPHSDGGGQLWMMLVGGTDGTKVSIAPHTQLPGGGGLGDATLGQVTDFTIDAGQVLQWIGADPTGAVLQSTQPVGVFTGSTYLQVVTTTSPALSGKDAAHQQLPPIGALGSEYVGGGVMTRLLTMMPESVSYRILGVVDGTTLTFAPVISGTPATLDAGMALEFQTTSTFTVKSQDDMHPFSLTQYMPGAPVGYSGAGCDPVPPLPSFTGCDLGDEDWVSLVAPKQFLQRYVFFTDPTYATTNLVLTRVKGPNGFEDVTVDCLGAPVTGWQAVGTGGEYEVAYLDLVRGTVPVAQCNGSRHEATSKGAFGVVVWGTDWYSSYGYPAGGNVGAINSVTVPPVPK